MYILNRLIVFGISVIITNCLPFVFNNAFKHPSKFRDCDSTMLVCTFGLLVNDCMHTFSLKTLKYLKDLLPSRNSISSD